MEYSRDPFIEIPGSRTDPRTAGSARRTASVTGEDIFAEKTRAAWHSSEVAVPRCDFASGRTALTPVSGGFRAVTLWRRSLYGMSLDEIKASPEMPRFCASNLASLISSVLGSSLSGRQFIIVAPPKRRHPGKENFASRMCSMIAAEIGLTYIDDFAICSSRQRIGAQFSLGAPVPDQENIIVVDDIITTGSTLAAMHSLITSIGRNSIFFSAILNRK